MPGILFVVLSIIVILPILWFVSEFQSDSRAVRCTLGIFSILSCFAVAWLSGQFVRLEYNAYYGSVTKNLLNITIEKLESGETQTVLQELKTLQGKYQPTYENRAHFHELATETAKRLRADSQPSSTPLSQLTP